MKKCLLFLFLSPLISSIYKEPPEFNYSDSTFAVGSMKYLPFLGVDCNDLSQSEQSKYYDSIVQFLNTHRNIYLELGYHSNERGAYQYNKIWTMKLAQIYKNKIMVNLIDTLQFRTVGYGESIPLVKNAKTEEEHYKNKRCELIIIDIRK